MIGDEALAKLRPAVAALGISAGEALPHEKIVEFGALFDGCANVTLDFAATVSAGFPILVIGAGEARDPRLDALSPRELQVAVGIGRGLANKQIARLLQLSPATVKDHVHRILQKTGLANRAAVAACRGLLAALEESAP